MALPPAIEFSPFGAWLNFIGLIDQNLLAQHTLKRARQLCDGVRLGEEDAEAEFVRLGVLFREVAASVEGAGQAGRFT